MNKWVGSSKEKLISDWGIPSKIVEVEPGGEILVFAEEVKFLHGGMASGPGLPGQPGTLGGSSFQPTDEVKKWQYTIFLVDLEGKIYHLTQQFYTTSPDKINFQVSKKSDS
ncbi:hypothetical protein [Cognataquiflexum rubidum]|uniref:hypothetical protein n=1 Tax=Cognataquiflexum rubidum TaxID=2922273 RepID=UPI001F131449|nr:hypothetical protein [Cognataquiflexum rubidum]MCH6236040.1 hypothetical protein [Cognataquiflexum rubidum]